MSLLANTRNLAPIIFALCGVLPCAASCPDSLPMTHPMWSRPFMTLDGQTTTLAAFRKTNPEKILVLNLWATWCAPCVKELPAFSRLQKKWSARARFLGLAIDTRENVRAFLARQTPAFPVWLGSASDLALFAREREAVSGLPMTLALDRDLRVLARHSGAFPEETLEELLRKDAPRQANPWDCRFLRAIRTRQKLKIAEKKHGI
ncbi:MAG: TlpA family protein disulfide reductase [Zoogloeaceae bacterium]|jgi:thiol-disulfide isomerase/thioredoxin|nr:TlpA family protein disulfide reductase [Zoogloeaceae bacterium]